MTRKLTKSIDDRVYDGLHATVGNGNIGNSSKIWPAYAEMAADRARDAEADEWCEALVTDVPNAPW